MNKVADPEYRCKRHAFEANVPFASKGPFFIQHEAVEKAEHVSCDVRNGVMNTQAFHEDKYHCKRDAGIEYAYDTESYCLHYCSA